jgi:hypothetical protein
MVLSLKWMAIFCATIILLGAFAVFGLKVITVQKENEEENPEEGSGVAVRYPFMLTIPTQNDTYRFGEVVNMTIALKNIGSENATLRFHTEPNPSQYWFWRVYDENDGIVFYWKQTYRFPSVQDITLRPNEFMEVNCTWNQKNTDTQMQVMSGYYYLIAEVGFEYLPGQVGFEYEGTDILLESKKAILISS